jgi:RNA-directed DNA polymerase
MDGRIPITAEAENIVRTRLQLAELLGATPELISRICLAPSDFYTEFALPKPNGEMRTIRPPQKRLRSLQRNLLSEFYRRTRVRTCLHGGIRGKSVLTHAVSHVGRQMVATLDIRKFFPSTTWNHIESVVSDLGFRDEAAHDILLLVTLENQLPQGAPTSSFLANLAFNGGDVRFIKLCRRRKLRYSRYVDDIAVSGDSSFIDLRGPFMDAIELCNYSIAEEKVHFMSQSDRQIITGLVVNEKMRPTRQYITSLKQTIHFCIERGVEFAASIDGVTTRQLKNRLTGQVNYVRQVDPPLGKSLRGQLCGVDWRVVTKQLSWVFPQDAKGSDFPDTSLLTPRLR